MLFVNYHNYFVNFLITFRKSLLRPMSWSLYSLLFPSIFGVSCLTLRYFCLVLHKVRDMDVVFFSYTWMSSITHSTCWRGYHPYNICFLECILWECSTFTHELGDNHPSLNTSSPSEISPSHPPLNSMSFFVFCLNDSLSVRPPMETWAIYQ